MRLKPRAELLMAGLVWVVAAGAMVGPLLGQAVTDGLSQNPESRPAGSRSHTGFGMGGRPGSHPASQPAGPTSAEIGRVVRQLGHPVPARRREAIRRLAEWGPVAFGELRQAALGQDLEAAILARDLLGELEQTILIGVQIRMEVDRRRIAWDEPLTLTVHAHNPTPGPIRVPWPEPGAPSTTRPAGDDATQVGAMMDVADFLTVTGPGGRPIDLRMEPIGLNRAVFEAVDVRAGRHPPSHLVGPGQTAHLTVPLFNRGWARFPMLEAGTYTIALAYQPEWSDASWTKEGFGFVRAEPVTVEVRQPAPEPIQRSDRPVVIELRRTDDTLTVELRSTWDLPQWINLNWGEDLAIQARLECRFLTVGDAEVRPLGLGPGEVSGAMTRDRIHRLDPGATMTLTRLPVARIREHLGKAGWGEQDLPEVTVAYTNHAKPDEIRKALGAREPGLEVPDHIFSGTLSTDPIRIDGPTAR